MSSTRHDASYFLRFSGYFVLRDLHRVFVGKHEGTRRWEDMDVDLYTFLLPKSRVLRASTHAVQVNYIL